MGSENIQKVDNNFKLFVSGDQYNDIQVTKGVDGVPLLVSEDITGAADCRDEARSQNSRLSLDEAKALLTPGQTLIVREDGEMVIREVRAKSNKSGNSASSKLIAGGALTVGGIPIVSAFIVLMRSIAGATMGPVPTDLFAPPEA